MEVEREEQIAITVTLTKDEAKLLRGMIQNSPTKEPEELPIANFREQLFNQLGSAIGESNTNTQHVAGELNIQDYLNDLKPKGQE